MILSWILLSFYLTLDSKWNGIQWVGVNLLLLPIKVSAQTKKKRSETTTPTMKKTNRIIIIIIKINTKKKKKRRAHNKYRICTLIVNSTIHHSPLSLIVWMQIKSVIKLLMNTMSLVCRIAPVSFYFRIVKIYKYMRHDRMRKKSEYSNRRTI